MNGILNHWLTQACAIAVAASAILNGAPFLPWLRGIKPRRIEARWVGYVGLSLAFAFWLWLNPQGSAWQAGVTWGIIALVTLVPNTLIHWRDRDTNKLSYILTREGEVLLQRYLEDHAPEDPSLHDQFMMEQLSDSAEERWLEALAPWAGLLDEFDVAFACLIQAVKQEPRPWLLTTIANMIAMRQDVCRARTHAQLWYRMCWPEQAR